MTVKKLNAASESKLAFVAPFETSSFIKNSIIIFIIPSLFGLAKHK